MSNTMPAQEGPGRHSGEQRGGWLSRLVTMLQLALDELSSMKRTQRRQRCAEDAFQEQVQEELSAISESLAGLPELLKAPTAGSMSGTEPKGPSLTKPQTEALTRLDEAVHHLQHACRQQTADGHQPQSSEEGLAMLQVRVRNLQRSFGLQSIEGEGEPFDDRLQRVHSICHRHDLEDGVVVEVLQPGYVLQGQLLRAALVVVNRRSKVVSDSREGAELL